MADPSLIEARGCARKDGLCNSPRSCRQNGHCLIAEREREIRIGIPRDGGITESGRRSIIADLARTHPNWIDVVDLYINGLDIHRALKERLAEALEADPVFEKRLRESALKLLPPDCVIGRRTWGGVIEEIE